MARVINGPGANPTASPAASPKVMPVSVAEKNSVKPSPPISTILDFKKYTALQFLGKRYSINAPEVLEKPQWRCEHTVEDSSLSYIVVKGKSNVYWCSLEHF